jgi:photosystem II stability/assembly factor-like uncharacterized protein
MHRPRLKFGVSIGLVLVLAASVAGPASAVARARGSVLPDGFRAQAISFASPELGWILGVQTCGQARCTNVLHTIDGGDTWKKVGRIHAPLTYDKLAGVTEVRFADDLHGWAFGPSLWSTSDGGATWTKQTIPGDGNLLPVLAAGPAAVYALVSPCKLNQAPGSCDPPTLWKTTPGEDTWSQVSVNLRAGLVTNAARLVVRGTVAYLVVPTGADPDVVRVTTDGAHWAGRPDPCSKVADEMLVDVTTVSDTRVAFLCVGDPGFGHSTKRVFRSDDTGHTAHTFGPVPREGIVSQLAAAPNGRLVMTSWGAPGSWIYRSNAGHPWTTPLALEDQGTGWNDIVMTTNQVGFVVHGPAALFPGNRPGQLAETTNGGVTWNPV